jgi:catechol 2,3-dioxygenase-like lactoylglutathione lyase family enzyme
MFDHIGLHVRDVAASVAFYKAVMAPLGAKVCSQDESGAGLGPDGNAVLWLYAHKGAKGPNATRVGSHIAFAAPDRKSVEKFHAAGLKAGGVDNGPAGLRADYSPTYFAAFLTDPDGNNVEAVYMGK